MTLTELKYIIAVARERHFGRAAESCFISQPSLSVAVRKLEEELGVHIFERRSQEVSLTPVGESIVEQAQKVLDDVRRIEELAVQSLRSVASGSDLYHQPLSDAGLSSQNATSGS